MHSNQSHFRNGREGLGGREAIAVVLSSFPCVLSYFSHANNTTLYIGVCVS